MEGIIVLIILIVLVLPIMGIISYFKTQKLLRESIGDIQSDIAKIMQKLVEMGENLRKIRDKTYSPQESSKPDEPQEFIQKEPVIAHPPPIPDTITPSKPPAETVMAMHTTGSEAEKEPLQEEKPVAEPPPSHSEPVFHKEPKPKPQIVEDVQQVLSKIWSWIIVGEEHRRPNVSMEYAVASTWLLRLGIIALVVCVGYFLRWSMDKGLLGPAGRVALSVIAGLGMLVAGIKNLKNKYRLLAEGFLGGGLACLYFATYAAGPMYDLVPITISFGLMCLVTVTAGVLALRTGSQLVAILGIIGGYATPVMLSTGEPNFTVLYSYMTLLGLGILGISHLKQWRLLNYLGFIFTWGLFFESLDQYKPELHFTTAIIFLSVLFVLHSTIVYYYNLVRKKKSTLLEVLHLLLNSILFSTISYNLIAEAHGKPWPAVMSIALAAFYIIHIYVFLKGRQHDRNILIVFIGLAGFFTAWAVPLITEKETLTICWALLAFFILWVGLKLKSNMLIGMSSLLYLIVMGRLAVWDIPRNFGELDWSNQPAAEYWSSFASRLWTFGIVIGSVFGAFGLYRHKERLLEKFAVDEENNIPLPIPRYSLVHISFWCGIAFIFTVLYLEFTQMFSYYVPVQTPLLTCMWVLLGLFLFYKYTKIKHDSYIMISIFLLIITVGKLIFFDFGIWGYMPGNWVYRQGGLDILMRLLDYGVIFVFIIFLAGTTRTFKGMVNFRKVFTVVGTALLFLYLTLETNTFFHWQIPLFQTGAISVLWALFAISYLVFGIRKTSRSWRYSGLLLFIIVVGKVFLVDLADMETIYRVIAFMFVGVLLIAGAFAYIKADKKFIAKEKAE